MDYNNKEIKRIILSGQIGIIANILSKKLGITPLQALKDFYRSKTCAMFHDRRTGLYLYSEGYIADEYLLEINQPL